jgi:hypothetical protein
MERTDDFTVYASKISLSAAEVARRIAIPRTCRVIKSYWVQNEAWDGSVAVKLTGSRGDLADSLVDATAGAAGDVNEVHHGPADANQLVEGSVLVMRPL